MENKRKNKIMKTIWVTKSEEKMLIDYLDGNYPYEFYDLLRNIYRRGDLDV
jgi:hypothetical protein